MPSDSFRVNRKKFGLTWACPKCKPLDDYNSVLEPPTEFWDNPIPDKDAIQNHLENLGKCKYLISEELHENKTRHYHAFVNYEKPIDSINPRLFDVCGVHPNILTPKGGWEAYVAKHGDFSTNYYESNPWTAALNLPNSEAAIEHLWTKVPRDMCVSGDRIEAQIRKRMRPTYEYKVFNGPFPSNYYPETYDMFTHSLLICGPPGIGKTQLARYLLGKCEFCKASLDQLKTLNFEFPFIMDDIDFRNSPELVGKELTDVENGGNVPNRYADIFIPPGVPRIFTSNYQYPFADYTGAIYGRRLVTLNLFPASNGL